MQICNAFNKVGKANVSPNGKPCKAARKPKNYSYDKTSTCEGENTLNKVGKAKHIFSQW